MHPNWHEIKRLLDRALDLPVPERTAFLEKECGEAMAVKRAVVALLEADEDLLSFVDKPLARLTDAPGRRSLAYGTVLGAYRLLEPLAIGGTATVYRARCEPGRYPGNVAIKVPHPGMGRWSAACFANECRILSRLRHPHIVALLGTGSLPSGTPFAVMEWIEGEPIDGYCRRKKIPEELRLRFLKTLCDTVEDLHRQSVVHGDLKPDNILVTRGAVLKVLDFGASRLLSEAACDQKAETGRARWLTPEFTCPQGMRGEPPTIASDIYALGRLGLKLFQGPAQKSAGLRRLFRDAVWPEPDRRYSSAGAFSTAIGRYLEESATFSKNRDTSSRRFTLYT